jgi:hypothetical protein
MGSRRMENEENEELLGGERCDTPFWFSENGSRRMQDVNYLLLIYYPVHANFSKNVPISMTPGEKRET